MSAEDDHLDIEASFIEHDLITLGTQITHNGELLALRKRLNISRTSMAACIGVSSESIKRWEAGTQGMKRTTAMRVAAWWLAANEELARFTEQGGDLSRLNHISSTVSSLGVSQKTVITACQEGRLDCVDLGVLGIFIYDQKPAMKVAAL